MSLRPKGLRAVIRKKKHSTNFQQRQKISFELNHDLETWTLQPELETIPWDSQDELLFPVQVPATFWALIKSPTIQESVLESYSLENGSFCSISQDNPHKKRKMDSLRDKPVHPSERNLTKNQLLVENIPPEATSFELQDHVVSFGQIHALDVLRSKSTNITQQLHSVTATVFFEKDANVSELGSFDWKVLGKDVAAYLIRRSSLMWMRLTNLPHRTKTKMLRKCLSQFSTVAEVVRHNFVSRTAVLTFKERSAVQDILEAQHNLKKLLGNRLVFIANGENVKKVSVSPIQVNSLSIPENYTALHLHHDTGHYHHNIVTLASNNLNTMKSNGQLNIKSEQTTNGSIEKPNGILNIKTSEGSVTQWEYGEALAPCTMCIVGLPADVKKKRLKKLLNSVEGCLVVEVTLHRDRWPAHAYVTFEDKDGVDKALETQCQFSDNCPRLLHCAASKTLSAAYLTELLFQADRSSMDSHSCDVNMFLSFLSRHITADDSSSAPSVSKDPFELPPNTVFVVGALGNSLMSAIREAFNRCGKVLYVELLKESWPVHAYVTYRGPDGVQQAVNHQPQVNHHMMTLTLAVERKLTLNQIVELAKEYPKLHLDSAGSATPLFYRREFKAPVVTSCNYSRR